MRFNTLPQEVESKLNSFSTDAEVESVEYPEEFDSRVQITINFENDDAYAVTVVQTGYGYRVEAGGVYSVECNKLRDAKNLIRNYVELYRQ